jgi:GntR family transcriptional regulator
VQLAEQLRRTIAMGAVRPGERLPTIRELAVQARVNRNTAARVIQRLEAEGLVRTRVGQGTFVEESVPPVDRRRSEATIDELLDRVLVEAQTAGVPLEEIGWRLSRRIDRFQRERGAAVGAGGREGSTR